MDTFIRLIEAEVHNALQGARIIGMIHTERDVRDGYTQFHGPQRTADPVQYIEDGYVIAWQRDGERSNFGTHRAQANNGGEVMLVHGHYDIPNKTEALRDMLNRADVSVPTNEAESEITQLQNDLQLSVCYSPAAIRDSFDNADDDENKAWAEQATDEQLLEVSHMIVNSDPTWKDFHANIEMCVEEVRKNEDDKAAAKDREERPYVVGETVNPGVIERFATHDEAAQYITDHLPADKALAGDYYIDGPETADA